MYNYTTNNDPNNNGAKSRQLTGITDVLDATRNRAYTYDKLARLKEVKGGTSAFTAPTWWQIYSYDRYGNRGNVTMSGNPGTIPLDGITGLTYNTASNRLTNANFEYDAAGNQTRGRVEGGAFKRSRYDAAGRLAEVRDDADTLQEKYSYGASNERFITTTGSTARYYAWDGGQTVAEYSGAVGSGTLTWQKSYVYAGGRLLATTTPGNNKQYHHPDRLGTRVITDTNGAFSGRQESLPFGAMIDASAATTKRFTSYDRSATTKLDYTVNRFYNAAQGRFTQVDPLGMSAASLEDPQTLNLYAYCGNDPVNHADPDGLFFKKLFKWIGKIFKAIAVAVFVAGAILLTAGLAAVAIAGTWSAFSVFGEAFAALMSGVGAFFGGAPTSMIINFFGVSAGASAAAGLAINWTFTGIGAVSNFVAQKQKAKEKKKSETVIDVGLIDTVEVAGKLPTPEQQSTFWDCYERNQFSSLFKGTRFHTAVVFLEVGSYVSLTGDAVATTAKADGKKLGNPQPYASGLNWLFRRVSKGAVRGILGCSPK